MDGSMGGLTRHASEDRAVASTGQKGKKQMSHAGHAAGALGALSRGGGQGRGTGEAGGRGDRARREERGAEERLGLPPPRAAFSLSTPSRVFWDLGFPFLGRLPSLWSGNPQMSRFFSCSCPSSESLTVTAGFWPQSRGSRSATFPTCREHGEVRCGTCSEPRHEGGGAWGRDAPRVGTRLGRKPNCSGVRPPELER